MDSRELPRKMSLAVKLTEGTWPSSFPKEEHGAKSIRFAQTMQTMATSCADRVQNLALSTGGISLPIVVQPSDSHAERASPRLAWPCLLLHSVFVQSFRMPRHRRCGKLPVGTHEASAARSELTLEPGSALRPSGGTLGRNENREGRASGANVAQQRLCRCSASAAPCSRQ